MNNKVYSVKALLSKSEYESKYKNNSKVFTPKELSYLKDKSVMTGAGFIAAKSALISLCKTIDNVSLNECDIELSHNSEGAPIINSLSSDISKDKLKISISHSKNKIVGLASSGDNE